VQRMVIPIALALATLSIAPAIGQTPAPQMPAGITRTQLLDNPAVMVARLKLEPGAREMPHTHPFSAIVIHITPGEIDMLLGDKRATTRRDKGHVEFIPREVTHAAANVGSSATEVLTVAIKPDRRPAPAVPVSASPEGIVRTVVLENDEARVTRVGFSPGAREPEHTHPYDMLLVASSGGRLDLLLGGKREVEDRPAGFVWFLPRDVVHAAISAAPAPIEFFSVGIK
jgi:quercetin dioxygenase-like cupin family protein